jgi:GAF domain-containing protein
VLLTPVARLEAQLPEETVDGRRTFPAVGGDRRGRRDRAAPNAVVAASASVRMAVMRREDLLVRTMVDLADNLVDEFDLVEMFTLLADRSVAVLDVAAAGLMLVAPEGGLRVMASSSEALHLEELVEVQADEGPCLDCYRTGEAVTTADLAREDHRWPRFAPVARAAGFRSVHAVPMRVRQSVIGALNLFNDVPGALDEADLLAARALADVASIAILQHRAVRDARTVNEQLNHALNNRILIEQAKGVLAERAGIEVDAAFTRMRGYARDNDLRLVDIARKVVDEALDIPPREP